MSPLRPDEEGAGRVALRPERVAQSLGLLGAKRRQDVAVRRAKRGLRVPDEQDLDQCQTPSLA